MTNSIKYILKKRNMKQKDLIPSGDVKQYVSRWILRQRIIPKHVVLLWETLLEVPAHFFVDEKGYCKQLNEADIDALEEYFIDEKIPAFCEELKNSSQAILAERKLSLEKETRRLKKSIQEDIYHIKDIKEIESMEQALDEQESSVYFYNKILRLHKSEKIHDDEWTKVLRALTYLVDGTSKEDNEGLAYDIYSLILQYRERKVKENAELKKNYAENFSSEIDT